MSLIFYFILHCWFSRSACCISETRSGSVFWFPALCAETALKTKLYFSCFVHHRQQERLWISRITGNSNSFPTRQRAVGSSVWWLCSASVGAACAGELVFERQRGVTQEVSLVCWDKQGCSPTLSMYGWETHTVCPQGSRNSLREFEGKVKGGFVLSILLLDCTQGGLYPDCVTEGDQRELLLWFPAWILHSIPSYLQQKCEEKGTVGLCVSAPAKEHLAQMEPFSPRANLGFHKVCPVVWGWREVLSSALLGCCFQSTESIHINVHC